MTDDLRADLDRLIREARQGCILDRLERRERAWEITEIVGEQAKL